MIVSVYMMRVCVCICVCVCVCVFECARTFEYVGTVEVNLIKRYSVDIKHLGIVKESTA